MSTENKKHIYVRKDTMNKWYYFGRNNLRIQLCGDNRKGGFWIKQYAKKAGVDPDKFMADFSAILELMEKDGQAIFSMYEMEQLGKKN